MVDSVGGEEIKSKRMLTVDLSELPAGVVKEFATGRHAREVLAAVKAPEQQLAAAQAVTRKQWRSMDGTGRLRMVITPTAYHYWGRRLGYACWQDEQFLREFERDNPEVRVKCGGTRIQQGYRQYVPSEALKAKFPPAGGPASAAGAAPVAPSGAGKIVAVGKYSPVK